MSERTNVNINDVTLQRVYGEFLEMPGLCVTCAQGQRLWGLDEDTCRQLLEFLVDVSFLRRLSNGSYSRLTDGHSAQPRPRLAKAGEVPARFVRPGRGMATG